ncbi:MAG TPA: glycosyltransferase family 39 protein [Candidatus Sulfomarinibacteraceae bacterium]|nr:glycosyltransferase family 39 protein [Candidatus Sulfomarinibacteraceae bacterium]
MNTIASENKADKAGPASIAQRLTVGHAVLLAIVIAAAIMRFTALGAGALSPDEAQRALDVWRFWQPGEAPPAFDVSPAYFSLSVLLFPLLGDSDAVARLIPALAGVALAALPWLARERLGTVGALTTSLLLAVSPTASIISVTAGGDALALAATLLLLVAWLRYQNSGELHWLQVTAGALGLGLASSPLFYSALATMLAAWMLQTKLGETPAASDSPSPDGQPLHRSVLIPAAASGGVVFLLLATLFLWRPTGLGAAATLLAQWLADFTLQGSVSLLLAPFLALGRYELIVVVLGAAAIFWASWRGRPLPLFLVFWFSAAILVILLQRGVAENVLLLVLPAYLLIGMAFDAAFRRPATLSAAGTFVALLVLGAIVYFNGARYLRVLIHAPEQLSLLFLALLAIVFAIVLINFVRSWDETAALQGSAAALLVLFLIFNWGTAWWLTHEARNDPREQWVGITSDDDVLLLAKTLEDVSWQVDGSRYGMALHSGVDHQVLRWYLRHFKNASFGVIVRPESQQPAIISAGDSEPALGADYMGSDYRLLVGVDPQTPASGLAETLRWWFFREHPASMQAEQLILWVRSDVLPR